MRRRAERRAKDLGAIPDPCNALRREALLLPTSPLHAANQRWRAAELVTRLRILEPYTTQVRRAGLVL